MKIKSNNLQAAFDKKKKNSYFHLWIVLEFVYYTII